MEKQHTESTVVLALGRIVVTSSQVKNQRAYREMEEELGTRYPHGHFVAFDDGQVVADAPDFDQLTEALIAIGKNRSDVFVVQAGVAYPDEVFILL